MLTILKIKPKDNIKMKSIREVNHKKNHWKANSNNKICNITQTDNKVIHNT